MRTSQAVASFVVAVLSLTAAEGVSELNARETLDSLSEQPTQVADSIAVLGVVRGFKAALVSGDSVKALSFLHDDLIVFESRQAENLTEYRSGHLAADMNYLKTVTQTTTKETFRVSGEMAVYTSLFTSSGTSRGRNVSSNGTETVVLARTPSGWKILHIHW